MSVYYRGMQTSVLPSTPTYSTENGVNAYQWRFYNLALESVSNLERVLDIEGSLEDDIKVIGSGATPGTRPDLNIDYTKPSNLPTWDYTLGTFPTYKEHASDIKPLFEGHNVEDPGDAPVKTPDTTPPISYPDEFIADRPGDAPIIIDVIIPDPPEMDTIADPKYTNIDLDCISCDGIAIPDFEGSVPSIPNLKMPSADISWSEEDYDSTILQATQARISELLAGGVGIPTYIWELIWGRSKDKTAQETERAVSEITDEWAAKGFSIPQGAQLLRIDKARTTGIEQLSEHARELAIKTAEHEIENLKFAVAQGKALEEMIGGWHQQRMGRALDALKFVFQAQVEVLNAQITFFKAQIELFNTEVTQYKAILEGKLAQLQSQKTYLEGQKLIGDLNELEVRIYEANLKAYATELEGYNSKVKGLMAKAENNTIRMQGYKTEVEAYGEFVKAWVAEWSGVNAQVDVKQLHASLFETEVKAYSTEVQAFGTKIDAAYKPNQQRQINNENEFKKFSASLESHNAKLEDVIKQLNAYEKQYDGNTKEYATKVENEKNRVGIKIDEVKASTSIADQGTKVNMANAKNFTDAAIAEAEILRNSSELMSKAYSQLAASALGAIHITSSVQDSTSNTLGQSIRYNGGDV